MEEETEEYAFPNKYRLASVVVMVGALAVLGLVILGFIAPGGSMTLDQAGDISEFYTTVEQHQDYALLATVLDTLFITGYLALFAGLWLVIRDFSDIIATLSLLLGLAVGLLDLVENAMLFALILGIPQGWSPETSIFNLLWTTNQLIDICSYVAAIFFGVQFVMIFPKNRIKFSIGALFLLYALVGFLAILFPALFLIRSLIFVLGLALVTIMLFNEHELSDEELLQLLQRSPEKTDYIR